MGMTKVTAKNSQRTWISRFHMSSCGECHDCTSAQWMAARKKTRTRTQASVQARAIRVRFSIARSPRLRGHYPAGQVPGQARCIGDQSYRVNLLGGESLEPASWNLRLGRLW